MVCLESNMTAYNEVTIMAINQKTCESIMAETLATYTALPEEVIEEMVAQAPLKSFDKGTVIQNQGDPLTVGTYFIVKGCIRQFSNDENGKEITVNFYREQEPINLITFLDRDKLSNYSLACLEDCVVAYCEDIEDDGSNDPVEIQALERLFLQKQYTSMQMGYTNMKLKSPEDRFNLLADEQADLIERVPQIYLASYLGITPESYSRFKKRRKLGRN